MVTTPAHGRTRPRNFLRPCLLLLLRERPTHGCELMEQLGPFGFDAVEPGAVYRALRALEQGGYVHSGWVPSDCGPARRTYVVTPAGEALLEEWVWALRQSQRAISTFLDRFEFPLAADPWAGLEGEPARA